MHGFPRLPLVAIATVLSIAAISSLAAGRRSGRRIADIDRAVAATAAREAVKTIDAFGSGSSSEIRSESRVITNRDI